MKGVCCHCTPACRGSVEIKHRIYHYLNIFNIEKTAVRSKIHTFGRVELCVQLDVREVFRSSHRDRLLMVWPMAGTQRTQWIRFDVDPAISSFV